MMGRVIETPNIDLWLPIVCSPPNTHVHTNEKMCYQIKLVGKCYIINTKTKIITYKLKSKKYPGTNKGKRNNIS